MSVFYQKSCLCLCLCLDFGCGFRDLDLGIWILRFGFWIFAFWFWICLIINTFILFTFLFNFLWTFTIIFAFVKVNFRGELQPIKFGNDGTLVNEVFEYLNFQKHGFESVNKSLNTYIYICVKMLTSFITTCFNNVKCYIHVFRLVIGVTQLARISILMVLFGHKILT